MTNYIEEMMNTAGVHYTFKPIYKFRNDGTLDNDLQKELPKFTAKKQIEIIKLMCDLPYSADFKFEISKQDEDWIVTREIPIKEKETTACYAYSGRSKNFAESLAEVVKDLISAGELDKQKVKEILEV